MSSDEGMAPQEYWSPLRRTDWSEMVQGLVLRSILDEKNVLHHPASTNMRMLIAMETVRATALADFSISPKSATQI